MLNMLSTLEFLHHLRYPHGSLPYFLQVSFQTPTHQGNFTQHPVKQQSSSHLNQAFLSFLKSIYLFLAVLGLCCHTWAFSSYGEWGLLSTCDAWASHCSGFSCWEAWALGCAGFSTWNTWALDRGSFNSYGPWASLLQSMWDLPGPGIKPVSPTLAGGFLTTGPPGKSKTSFFFFFLYSTVNYIAQWTIFNILW